jgi:hypothetical protein
MLETKSRTIDGLTFHVTQLPLTKARATLVLLGQRIAPGLEGLSAAMASGGGSLGDADGTAVLGALGKLLEGLSDADLETLSETFGSASTVDVGDGKTPYLDRARRETVFHGGNLTTYFRWLAFAVEVNYSDFFALVASLPGPGHAPARAGK